MLSIFGLLIYLFSIIYRNIVAEGEGFEPPAPFRVQWFSRPPPSTTRPSLRSDIQATIRKLSRIEARLTRQCNRKCNDGDNTRRGWMLSVSSTSPGALVTGRCHSQRWPQVIAVESVGARAALISLKRMKA